VVYSNWIESGVQDRKRLLRDVWRQAWDFGVVDALDTLLAESYVRHTRQGSDQGLDQLKASILGVRTSFPDLVTTIEDIIEEGDRLAVRWISRGTYTDGFLGVPPTRKRIVVTGMTIARFDGDKVVEEWVTWDSGEFLAALGVLVLNGNDE
jgi:steroid delta-isomerase-like uncharacterized protein